jgi:hypothetical protein
MIKISLTILLVLLAAGYSNSAPSISNASVTSSAIAISGTDFGIKTTAAPLKFEQFEGATAGNTVPSELPYWSGHGGTKNGYSKDPLISSDNQRTSISTKNAAVYLSRSEGVDWVAQQAWANDIGFSSTGKVYVNLWVYFDPVDSPTFTDEKYTYYQIKLFNLNTETSSNGDNVRPYLSEFIFFDYAPPQYAGYSQAYHRNGRVSHADQSLHFDNSTINRTEANWYNVVLVSSPGTNDDDAANTDGWRVVSISDGNTAYQVKTETDKNYLDDETKGNNPIDSFKFGWYLGANVSTGATTIYYDDIYLDNTFQRVEIGDNATYANCTKREIQPPTAWTDTGATVTLNRGSFSPGDTAYVFVIDANNAPSTGYEITIPFSKRMYTLGGSIAAPVDSE